MRALKSYLFEDFMDSPRQSGRVHSLFEHAANFVFGGAMLTVLDSPDAEIPDSIVLERRDFARLRAALEAGDAATLEGGALSAGGICADFSGAPNFENFFAPGDAAPKREVARRLEEFEFHHVLPAPAEEALKLAAQAAAQGDAQAAAARAATVVGLGAGLTPSADDAIIGAAAALAFLEACGKPRAAGFAKLVFDAAKGRTTDASLKYLRCAAQGRFALPLARTVESFMAEGAQMDYRAVSILLAAGHSSGRDTLRGVRIFAEIL